LDLRPLDLQDFGLQGLFEGADMKRALGILVVAALALAGCGDDKLTHVTMGILKVTVINAGAAAKTVDLTLRCDLDSRDENSPIANPTEITVDDLNPGTCEARVITRGTASNALRSVWVSNVLIARGETTQITVDMADAIDSPKEICNGIDDDGDGLTDEPLDLLVCTQCVKGIESLATDDDRCQAISCADFFSYQLRGAVGNGFTCVKRYYQDITTARCAAIGKCLDPGQQTCEQHASKMEDTVLSINEADLCHEIDGCTDQTPPALANQPDGTDCAPHKVCKAGECVCQPACDGKSCGDDGCGSTCGNCLGNQTCSAEFKCVCVPACDSKNCGDDGCGSTCGHCDPSTEVGSAEGKCTSAPVEDGCADGSREGFQDKNTYPLIASCSGGWNVPGVTRSDLAPTCDRKAGNNGQNMAGDGCSAADLCAVGWHVCQGKTEVAAKAGAKGCLDSVPAGSPEKSMFFAVAQHSAQLSVCDDASAGDNDVFGCGNLGIQLAVDKNCGVLTRALASPTAGTCGYNEAEPPNGPWQCKTGAQSDIHEGGIVTKDGCPNTSCNWSGSPTANWDRGGVLCCKD
jgi:hypothetical protein